MQVGDWISLASLLGTLALGFYVHARTTKLSRELHEATAKLESQKHVWSREEVVFRRQLEALDVIAPLVAFPLTIAARLAWAEDRVVGPTDIDIEEYLHTYMLTAAHHYFVFEPAMIAELDAAQVGAWEHLASQLQAKTRKEFYDAAIRTNGFRITLFELSRRFLRDTVTGPLNPSDADYSERFRNAIATTSALLKRNIPPV